MATFEQVESGRSLCVVDEAVVGTDDGGVLLEQTISPGHNSPSGICNYWLKLKIFCTNHKTMVMVVFVFAIAGLIPIIVLTRFHLPLVPSETTPEITTQTIPGMTIETTQ